jgi:hypothetical protein
MDTFLREHRQMVDVARSIIDLARTGSHRDAGRLTDLRLQLSRAVTEHVSVELRFINASGRSDALDAETSSRYHHELLQWRHALMECNCAWPARQVFNDQEGFIRVFGPIVEALRKRVMWEENHLYPILLGKQQRPARSRAAA